jgi:hypothetical protein
MRRTRLFALVLIVLGVLTGGVLTAVPAAADPPDFDHLEPGGQPRLVERLPVNVVFIGYDVSQVNPATFFGALPRNYEPVVRRRLDYGVKEPLGITYRYDYRVRYADKAYQDKFFRQLKRLATAAPLTAFQSDYNDQDSNAKVVADNHQIDAPSVEKWLAYNPPGGVDTRRNTVFLINWHGRPDFVHHVYTKTDEPDPDTGYNFGEQRDSRKLVAWGGTTANDEENGLGSTRRVWFHDLSAGPESWSGNWNVDDADLDGDGEDDYRIPVAWEYGAYRPKAELTADLAKLVRYVALDLLFTPSPLYPVELPTREPPSTIDIDQNTYEGWPGVDASKTYLKPPLIKAELSELVWRNQLSYDDQDLPYRGHAKRCYEQAMEGVSCYPQLGYPAEANFFLQNTFQLARTQDDQGRVDYELPVFNYAVGEGVPTPALGFADDNYRDGTQSYVFGFVSPEIVQAGYGLTTTTIHEVGHHLGMSHPHDGYDSTSGVDFGPSGAYYFVNVGDETNSMMSYIDLNWDFSQFDRDNMDRYQTAALYEAANRLAQLALDAPQAEKAYDELLRADLLLGQAKASFGRHDYTGALSSALQAYESVVEGAREAGVDTDAAQAEARIAARESRRPSSAHPPHEFVDTLGPHSPRSQP